MEDTNNNNNNNSENAIQINGLDDIRQVLLSAKLTLPIANRIFDSPLREEFIVSFQILLTTTDLHSTTKVLFLVSCFENKLNELAVSLLDTERYTFVEILKCLKILDSKRALKALKKKYDAMIAKENQRQERIKKISDEYLSNLENNNNNNNDNKEKKEEIKKEDEEKKKVEKKSLVKKVTPSRAKKYSSRGRYSAAVINEEKRKFDKKEKSEEKPEPSTDAEKKAEEKKVKAEKREEKKIREAKFKLCFERSKTKMENKITELEQYGCKASLCGSITRLFKRWFKSVPAKTLEYFALGQPKETWKEIADLLHLAPSDFQVPWFLEFMFGKAAPEGTSVRAFDDAKLKIDAGETVDYGALLDQFKPPYSFLRKRLTEGDLAPLRLKIAAYEDINLVIWWYHEFKDVKGVSSLIADRVSKANSSELTLAYGTLIEKTMALTEEKNPQFKPVFNALLNATMNKLSNFGKRFSLPPPIGVLGDRSGSMEIAIRLATIIGYLVSNLSKDSRLSFFNTEDMEAPVPPSSIDKLFKLTDLVSADGGTSPAVGLKPYLDQKKPLKYLVVVTDEEENQQSDGMDFSDMFVKYRKEVAPDCKLVFVSFLRNNTKGQMVTELKDRYNIEPIQFVLDRNKPDVTKIDHMLTSLSCESPLFKTQHNLITKVFNLFDIKFFSKFIKENKKNFFEYSFNSEIVIMVLKKLCAFYLKKLPKDDQTLTFFKSRVLNESNCLQLVNEYLRLLVTVSKECDLETLSSFCEETLKTFNSLERSKSISFLELVLDGLDQDLLKRPVDLTTTVYEGDSNNNNKSTKVEEIVSTQIENPYAFKDKLIDGTLTIPEIVALLTNGYTKDKFIPVFIMLLNSIDLVSKVKINTLCAAFECKQYSFAQLILYNKKYGFKEVSKAIKVLDSGRQVRQLKLKLEKSKLKHDERAEKLRLASEEYMKKKALESNDKEKKEDDDNNNNNNNKKPTTTTTTATKPKGKKSSKKSRKNKGDEKEKKEFKEKLKSGKLSPLEKRQREKLFEQNYENGLKSLETRIAQLEKYESKASLSGNICKMFKKWLKTFPEKTLEYFALGQPKEVWREMADLLHLSSKDFQAEWFLPSCYNRPHNGESINAFNPTDLTEEQLKQLIVKYKPSYSYIRKRIPQSEMTDELRLIIANYEELSIVLWWYHELATFDVDTVIARRLTNNELDSQSTSLGTLLERAIHFQQQGIPLFRDILPIIRNAFSVFSKRITLPPPLMTLGDASNSMDIAIKISTIIASLVTSLTDNASLRFFNHAPLWAPIDPTNLSEVFNVANIIQGSGSTSPAAGLYPVFESGQSLRYLVLVTDEEENSNYKSYSFLKLYKEYIQKVAPDCKLVFVSFLRQNEEGQMTAELKANGITPLQFCLDKNRPDVTKIDDLITTLSCHSDSFLHQIESFESMIRMFGEKYYYKYISTAADKYFVDSFTLETMVHMLDVLAQFVEGSLIDNENEKELVEHIYKITNKRTVISLIKEIVDDIKFINQDGQYEHMVDATNKIQLLLDNTTLSELRLFEQFNSIVNDMKSNKDLYSTKKIKSDNKELLAIDNDQADKSSSSTSSLFQVEKIKFEREYGVLNEFDVNVMFSYIDDLETLKNCSLVSRLWRKCTINPQHWTRFMNAKDIRQLDLVFLVDNTGSMGGEIATVKREIKNIVDDIVSIGSIKVRVAMVFYNDHDHKYNPDKNVCTIFKFTSDIAGLRANLEGVTVYGGNDHPEAMADGFYEVSKLDFAKGSTKVCIVIGDAPPHGFGGSDTFPGGCPCGHDMIDIVRNLVQSGVTFYTVMCRGDSETYNVMNAVADLSEGRFVMLANANDLATIITGSAKESILLDTIASEVLKEIEAWQFKMPHIAKEEAIYRASYSLRARGVKVPKPRTAGSGNDTNFVKNHIYQSIMKSDTYLNYKVSVNASKVDTSVKKKTPKTPAVTTNQSSEELISIGHVRKIAKKHHLI